jgi:hypothetical protein
MPRPYSHLAILCLSTGILLSGCSLGEGQESVPPTHYIRVTGTVTDSTGEGIPRISVQLDPDSIFALARRTTDDDGKFTVTSDATFVPASGAPDSADVAVKFYPTEGRHRDSLLLTVPVRLRVVPIEDPADPVVLNVEIELP